MKSLNFIFRYFAIGIAVLLSACNPDEPEEAPLATIKLTLESVTNISATVTITPDENTAGYTYAIGEAGDLEAFEAGTLEGITNKEGKAPETVTFSGLSRNTEYTVFARANNSEDKGGKIETLVVNTADNEYGIDIELIESTETSISVTFTPTEKTESYAYAIGMEDDLAAFEDGSIEGYTVITEDVQTPKYVMFEALEHATEYTVFALPMGAGGIKGDVVTRKISTETPESAFVQITLADRTYYMLSAHITGDEPTVGISYAIGMESDFDAFEAGTLAGIETVDYSGESILATFEDLEPGTTYTIFARGINEFGDAGQVITLPVRVFDLPQVEMDILLLNNSVIKVQYTLNESSIGGITTLLTKASYDAINTSQSALIESILGMQILGTAILYEEDMVRPYYIQTTPGSQYVIINLVIYTDRNGEDQYQINTENVTTPPINPNAPTPSLTVEVVRSERYATEFKFTTGEGTYIFQHSLLPKMLYDMMMQVMGEEAILADLLQNGRIGYEGTSTYTYDHTGAGGIKGNEDAYIFGVLYGENGVGELQIFETFFIPAN